LKEKQSNNDNYIEWSKMSLTIKSNIPDDTEVNQLHDVGRQITKYIYSNAHTNKIVVVLPTTKTKLICYSDICNVIKLRGYIQTIIMRANKHKIDISIK
jgi:hypothetical protein